MNHWGWHCQILWFLAAFHEVSPFRTCWRWNTHEHNDTKHNKNYVLHQPITLPDYNNQYKQVRICKVLSRVTTMTMERHLKYDAILFAIHALLILSLCPTAINLGWLLLPGYSMFDQILCWIQFSEQPTTPTRMPNEIGNSRITLEAGIWLIQ